MGDPKEEADELDEDTLEAVSGGLEIKKGDGPGEPDGPGINPNSEGTTEMKGPKNAIP